LLKFGALKRVSWKAEKNNGESQKEVEKENVNPKGSCLPNGSY
jgi:hypothetical protein